MRLLRAFSTYPLAVLAALALIVGVAPPTHAAAPTERTVTYRIGLKVDSTLVVGPFSSTETVTADIVANATTPGNDPTAWHGVADLNFGPIVNTGLPAGCQLTTAAPTGSIQVDLVKQGDNVEVTWNVTVAPLVPSVVTCMGYPAPFLGGATAEPFLLLEPHTFTVPGAGGTQALNGKLSTAEGIMENVGTMTVTQRVECGPKVKAVNTYPPGQTTSASSMVGKAFTAGEKVTADTNVEFVFEDGSVARLAKGASIKQDAKCESFTDKSKNFKGTLLLGKIWYHIVAAIGDPQVWELPRERAVTGHRGTTFWMLPGKKSTRLSVSEGSMWVSHGKAGKLTGKTYIVRKNHTAEITKKSIVVRKSTKKDAFPFG